MYNDEVKRLKSIIAYLLLESGKGTARNITYQSLEKIDNIDVIYKEDPYLQTVIVSIIKTNA